ncbi:MAG: rhodanese-like domain-containing protein [Myxococcales bacterium]|nr:rhodanese-like domain-containing protein [Myxococcales bacterium]
MFRPCTMTLAILCFLAACDRSAPPAAAEQAASAAPSASSGGTIDGAQARKLVGEGAKLVDVRSPAEYAEKHVDGADNVPVDAIAEHDLGPKDGAIVLYCHSGKRSARAAASLRARGYTRVYDLGGMSNW